MANSFYISCDKQTLLRNLCWHACMVRARSAVPGGQLLTAQPKQVRSLPLCRRWSPCPTAKRDAPGSAVQVAFFLPQLVQLLRADEGGMIQDFLFTAARRSTLFGHKLICTLRVRLSDW